MRKNRIILLFLVLGLFLMGNGRSCVPCLFFELCHDFLCHEHEHEHASLAEDHDGESERHCCHNLQCPHPKEVSLFMGLMGISKNVSKNKTLQPPETTIDLYLESARESGSIKFFKLMNGAGVYPSPSDLPIFLANSQLLI